MAQLDDTTPTPAQVAAFAEHGYSPEEVAILTPEERRVLLGDAVDSAAEAAAVAETTDDDGQVLEEHGKAPGYPDRPDKLGMPHAEDVDVDDPAKVAADAAVAEAEAAEDAAAKAKTDEEAKAKETGKAPIEPTAQERERRDFVPTMRVPDARDFVAERKTARAELNDARVKWGAGDLSNEDFFALQDRVQDTLDGLTRAETEASIALKYNTESNAKLWESQQADFLDDNPGYKWEASPLRYNALSETLKLHGAEWDKEGLNNRQALKRAKDLVEAEFGPPVPKDAAEAAAAATAAAAKDAEAKATAEAKAKAGRKPDLKAVPTTLAHVPSAADADVGRNSKFDQLDKLEGIEYERELARLPQEEQDRYLRNAA